MQSRYGSYPMPASRCLPSSFMLALASLLVLVSGAADAVPSFNRQTGQNCVACHAGGQFPDLTPYGRLFKLTGYTIGERAFPLAAMGVASYTKTRNTNDPFGDQGADFPKDGNFIFQTGSVFLAGKITDNVGGFVQVTYNNYDHQDENGHWVGHWVSDNMDFRYADRWIDPKNDLIFGITANNNPSVQDVWNSAPAWAFNVVPGSSGPPVTPILAGGLAANVAGAGPYIFWDRTLYAEVSAYRTADKIWSFMSQGMNTTRGDQQILKGANPYWRIALSHEWGAHSAMIGLMGLDASVYPDATDPTGPTNRFRDVAVDAQYQYLLDPHAVTLTLSYMHEKIDYADTVANQPTELQDASGNPLPLQLTNSRDTVNMFRAKLSYVYRAKYGGTLSYFDVTGSTNTLNQTSGVDPITGEPVGTPVAGNLSGNPSTRGATVEIFWLPVQYVRVGLQYTAFDKFNGARSNYDAFGRNARDNNTVLFYVWGAY